MTAIGRGLGQMVDESFQFGRSAVSGWHPLAPARPESSTKSPSTPTRCTRYTSDCARAESLVRVRFRWRSGRRELRVFLRRFCGILRRSTRDNPHASDQQKLGHPVFRRILRILRSYPAARRSAWALGGDGRASRKRPEEKHCRCVRYRELIGRSG
jgi:hypothetical protein